MEYDSLGPEICAIEGALKHCRKISYILVDHETKLTPPTSRPDSTKRVVHAVVISAQQHPISPELRQCIYALTSIMQHPSAQKFLEPVDPLKVCCCSAQKV